MSAEEHLSPQEMVIFGALEPGVQAQVTRIAEMYQELPDKPHHQRTPSRMEPAEAWPRALKIGMDIAARHAAPART